MVYLPEDDTAPLRATDTIAPCGMEHLLSGEEAGTYHRLTELVVCGQAVLPEEWENSYGMSVDEHLASTQVDLENGYTDAVMDSPDDQGEQAEKPVPREPDTTPDEARQYGTEDRV